MKRIRLICADQGLKVDAETLTRVVESAGHDIRQVVNLLQMWKGSRIGLGSASKDENVMINNFDAAQRLLDHGKVDLNIKYPTFRDKMDLFFIDYDFIPLLVQDSYLNAMGDRKSLEDVEAMADAAEYISLGDTVSRQVR